MTGISERPQLLDTPLTSYLPPRCVSPRVIASRTSAAVTSGVRNVVQDGGVAQVRSVNPLTRPLPGYYLNSFQDGSAVSQWGASLSPRQSGLNRRGECRLGSAVVVFEK